MCVVVIRTAMLMFQRTRKTTDRLELWRMGNFETSDTDTSCIKRNLDTGIYDKKQYISLAEWKTGTSGKGDTCLPCLVLIVVGKPYA